MIFSRSRVVLLTVVVITIDTLRADHIGCYGYKQIHTPNIDALAADGWGRFLCAAFST